MSTKSSAPSRSAESRRERRIVRDWLKAATIYAFAIDADSFVSDDFVNANMLQEIIVAFERADVLLASVAGYEGSSFVAD